MWDAADDLVYKISIHCSERYDYCALTSGGGAPDRNGFRNFQEESTLAFC